MGNGDSAMKQVQFAEVPVSGWFKETADGVWHLKTSTASSMYQCWGTRYEPRYSMDELVWVPQ